MVKKTINKEIKKKLARFKDAIESGGVPVGKVIVFGSYAKGRANKNSDIDVAVVSYKFGKNDVLEMQWLWKKTEGIDSRIEPYPVSPKDLKENSSPIISEINRYGVLI